MEETKFALRDRISTARYFTQKTAEMKDWRIRNKHNRLFRGKARELINGKGYLILTQKEAHQIDSSIEDSDNPKKGIWGYMYNVIWKKIQLVPC